MQHLSIKQDYKTATGFYMANLNPGYYTTCSHLHGN